MMGDHESKIRAFSQRMHRKAMESVSDPERGPDAKALYIAARSKINRAAVDGDIIQIAADTKAQIRALYKSSHLRGHEDQILFEVIDQVRDFRLWRISQN